MISKVFSGHSFYHACRYVVNKPGAEVLEYEGVRGHNFKVMSDDFIVQQQLRPEKEKACFHCCLSFYPGEKVSDEQMVRIAKEYLEKIKITNTQFAITKHTDRRHIHLHVVANMVDNNGKAISDSFLGLRGKKTAQQLTQQYKLIAVENKNLELTNYEALHRSEANKYRIYETIIKVLPHCKTMEELEKKLQLQGILTQYKFKGQTAEKQGISFKMGDDIFKGSKVDRQFSIGNLEKALAINQRKSVELILEGRENFPSQLFKDAKENKEQAGKDREILPANELAKGEENVIGILLQPEENYQQSPYKLLKENRRKRKKRSRNQGGGLQH